MHNNEVGGRNIKSILTTNDDDYVCGEEGKFNEKFVKCLHNFCLHWISQKGGDYKRTKKYSMFRVKTLLTSCCCCYCRWFFDVGCWLGAVRKSSKTLHAYVLCGCGKEQSFIRSKVRLWFIALAHFHSHTQFSSLCISLIFFSLLVLSCCLFFFRKKEEEN